MSKKILVVGGGFAGFWAAVAARRVAGKQVEIMLVSTKPVLEVRPRLYEAHPETLSIDIVPLLEKIGVSFVQDEAALLDAAGHVVTLKSGQRVSYDRLVVATGSRMRRPPIPGADTAFSIDSIEEAKAFDLRLAEIAKHIAEPTIAVVGGGFTGIELILELRDRLQAHNDDGVAERARLVLVDRSNEIGARLGPGPRPEIQKALAAAGIELRLGASVQALSQHGVTFADGGILRTDAIVLASGMEASPFAAQVPGDRDDLGRIIADTTLRAPSAPDVFVAGDAAAADTGDGHITLQSCQHAGQTGRVAGENAARDLLRLAPLAYEQARYLTCLDLGRSGAVITDGWARHIQKTGDEGKTVKRMVNTQVIYPPADGSAEALLSYSHTDLAQRQAPLKIGVKAA